MAEYKKPCVVSVQGSKQWHGVAADSLQELLEKACNILSVDAVGTPVTLVLAEDGTIVEDEDYFLCLPSNTKFVLLTSGKKWTRTAVDGGTAWLTQESVEKEVMELDGLEVPKWKLLAAELRGNLSSIIMMSESDLQTLIEVPCEELSGEIAVSNRKVQVLQDTVQRVLDRREEERQCKELLQLYLEVVKKEDSSPETGPVGADQVDASRPSQDEAISTDLLSSHVITILREKPLPHLCLSNIQLEAVASEDCHTLALALSWESERVGELQVSCLQELQRRNRQAQCLSSLSDMSARKKTLSLGLYEK
ncbi:DNA fragmentation factor subunit alpha [Pelodytes ibericus]